MARVDIKGEQRPIQKVFSDDFVLRVPHYQQPYALKAENAQELLFELPAIVEDGTVMLVKDDAKPEADVIDGQQRLATMTVLLAALRASTGGDLP